MPALDHALIDGDAERVVRRLTKGGFTAYLVGGCVRDLLLGLHPKDFDVATNATPNDIRATFRNCRIIGRRLRLAHVFFGRKIIETATFRANPREDEGDDDGDLLIRRDNVFGTETEDARRRDFTINGLLYDFEREDVILKFDGKDIRRSGDLPRIVAQTPIGKEVEVQVWRGGKAVTKKVTLGKLDEAPQKASLETTAPQQDSAASSTVLGLDVAPLNAETRRRFNIKDSIEGVVVLKDDPNSVAAERRVSAGDVIVEVQREAVKSAADIKKRLDALKAQGQKRAKVLADGATIRQYLRPTRRVRTDWTPICATG